MADDPNIPTVFGWDASDYDWSRGPMDIAAAQRDGIDFFTHKATEATWTKHTHYGEAMRRARDAGIPVLGAYHVVRSPADASREVDYCLSYVDAQTPWWRDFPCWFWQVDLEKWSYDNVPASEGEAFADIIEQRTGRKAVIYASRGQYGDALTGSSHLLWNANYGSNIVDHYSAVYAARGGDSGAGWVTYSGQMPVFWQYGSKTRIGTQNTCDANAFRGTLTELKALLNGGDIDVALSQEDIDNIAVAVWQRVNAPAGAHGSGYNLRDHLVYAETDAFAASAGVAKLLDRPPVQAAPVDPAAIAAAVKAALQDPAVLATFAAAVNDDNAARMAKR